MLKKIFLVIATIATLFIEANATAVLPPKYLSVEGFQQCLATKNMGTWAAWCLPHAKPKGCSLNSWRQLHALSGHDAVPSCELHH